MRAALALILTCTALTGCMGQGDDRPETSIPGPGAQAPGDQGVDMGYYGVDGDPVLGDPDAAVQVIAYDAPGCSNCRHYHLNAYQEVKRDFIDTGRIGYHFVQWTVGYAYDLYGGIGLECLHRVGGSQAYASGVDRAFANQTFGRWDDAADERVKAWLRHTAAEHAIDAEAVVACYDAEQTRSEVEEDIEAGRDSGAGSNPGFVVIGPDGIRTLRGATGPYDAIEEALG